MGILIVFLAVAQTAPETADAVLGATWSDADLRQVIQDGPDPWLVVEELLARREKDAAKRYASGSTDELLLAYANRSVNSDRPIAAVRVASAKRAADARAEALSAVRVASQTVTSVVRDEALGNAHLDMGNKTHGVRAKIAAARAATSLGWDSRSQRILRYVCIDQVDWIDSAVIMGLRKRTTEGTATLMFCETGGQCLGVVVLDDAVRFVSLGGTEALRKFGRAFTMSVAEGQRVPSTAPIGDVLKCVARARSVVVSASPGLRPNLPISFLAEKPVRYVPLRRYHWAYQTRPAVNGSSRALYLGDRLSIARVGDIQVERLDKATWRGLSAAPWSVLIMSSHGDRGQFPVSGANSELESIQQIMRVGVRSDVAVFDIGVPRFDTFDVIASGDPPTDRSSGARYRKEVEVAGARIRRAEFDAFLANTEIPTVLLSLWRTDPEPTQVLIERFLADYRKGKASAQALWDAKMFVRERPAWREPQFWAGWQVWGR